MPLKWNDRACACCRVVALNGKCRLAQKRKHQQWSKQEQEARKGKQIFARKPEQNYSRRALLYHKPDTRSALRNAEKMEDSEAKRTRQGAKHNNATSLRWCIAHWLARGRSVRFGRPAFATALTPYHLVFHLVRKMKMGSQTKWKTHFLPCPLPHCLPVWRRAREKPCWKDAICMSASNVSQMERVSESRGWITGPQ